MLDEHRRRLRVQRMPRPLCLLCVLQLGEDAHEFLGLPIGIAEIDRQVAVQTMGNLVDVVPDMAELGEQRRVQLEVSGRRLDLARADQLLAQSGNR